MVIENYISKTYPTVDPFEGINAVENKLIENQYLVVIDKNDKYYGILTTSDIIKRPHKIVIDCITEKANLVIDDTITSALEKFCLSQSFVLPVLKENNFIGVIEKNQIIKELRIKVNKLFDKSLVSEKVKGNFLNNLSHEIRTPLNGILGFLDLVSQIDTDDFTKDHKTFNNIIKKSANHFLIIMNDLIELSFVHTNNEVSINKNNANIVEILSELKNYFVELSLFENRKTTVIYTNNESSFILYTDRDKLKHILYHLINNAIKFSEDNKVILGFELKPDVNIISLFVKNKVLNVDQKDIPKMFDVFEKQENIGEGFNSGLGIGLSVVKNLTKLLGGNIKVETQNNEISFIVNLPIR